MPGGGAMSSRSGKKGVDILADSGGVTTIEDARSLFEQRMDAESLAKIGKIKNEEALLRIANAIAMLEPARAWVNSGSDADLAFIRKLSIEKGEEASGWRGRPYRNFFACYTTLFWLDIDAGSTINTYLRPWV